MFWSSVDEGHQEYVAAQLPAVSVLAFPVKGHLVGPKLETFPFKWRCPWARWAVA